MSATVHTATVTLPTVLVPRGRSRGNSPVVGRAVARPSALVQTQAAATSNGTTPAPVDSAAARGRRSGADPAGVITLVPAPAFLAGDGWQAIGAGDFNGDGLPDVLVRRDATGHNTNDDLSACAAKAVPHRGVYAFRRTEGESGFTLFGGRVVAICVNRSTTCRLTGCPARTTAGPSTWAVARSTEAVAGLPP
jgi:hypothetical protein